MAAPFASARCFRAASGLAAAAIAASSPPPRRGAPPPARPPLRAEVVAPRTVTDWGDPKKAAMLDAEYRAADVVRQRAEIVALLRPLAGEHVLDVGCGPGFLVEELAAAVGESGRVDGVDPSAAMCDMAAHRLRGLGNVSVHVAPAQELPYADGVFDAVVFSQVLLYIPDVPQALAEARRVLRPGGRIIICDTDWNSLVVNTLDADRFRRIFAACCSTFVHAHLPPKLPGMLEQAGFQLSAVATVPMVSAGKRVDDSFMGNWAFRIVPTKARGYGLPEEDVQKWLEEQSSLRDDSAFFACVHRFLFLARKP